MPQTTYFLDPDIAVPGMPCDPNQESFTKSYPAGEVIPFGVLCEVETSTGKLFRVKGAAAAITVGSLAGVSVFDTTREQAVGGGAASYKVGEMVPVLRKGRIFGAWDNGGTQTVMGAINVNHPSTTDPDGKRGVFTNTATNNTAGTEIAVVPGVISVRNVATLTPKRGAATSNNYTYVCQLELNLP